MEGHQGIYHRRQSDESEASCRDLPDSVAEIKETDREAAEDDGEV